MPKVVSQSNGIGAIKRSADTLNPHIVATTVDKNDLNNELETDQICTTPYANITVGRIQNAQLSSPISPSTRHSLSAHKRPKQKVRKPSKEFLNNKSGLICRKKYVSL